MSSSEQSAVPEDEQECGNVFDHDVWITHEDDEVTQWVCRRCGAEGWEDHEPVSVIPPERTNDE